MGVKEGGYFKKNPTSVKDLSKQKGVLYIIQGPLSYRANIAISLVRLALVWAHVAHIGEVFLLKDTHCLWGFPSDERHQLTADRCESCLHQAIVLPGSDYRLVPRLVPVWCVHLYIGHCLQWTVTRSAKDSFWAAYTHTTILNSYQDPGRLIITLTLGTHTISCPWW